MIYDYRTAFNERFTEARYADLLRRLEEETGVPIDFRVAETPVFVPKSLEEQLRAACDDIFSVLTRDDFDRRTAGAIPPGLEVPNQTPHSLFLAIDFAVCDAGDGALIPQLIELQGFPSLYFYQETAGRAYRAAYDLPGELTHLLGGLDEEEYRDLLRRVMLDGHAPENVVLLEIEPHKQKTRADFYATERRTGVRPVCISEVIREGRSLFYEREGRRVPIHRIYNRVIFDELLRRRDLPTQFNLQDDVDVTWAGHPNWFFKISKWTLPLLHSAYVPETHFLSEVSAWPDDLENWVLKPLYSFAGAGVRFDVTRADLEAVDDPANFILQRKVHYAPVVPTLDVPAKVEIRRLFVWPHDEPRPRPVISLARLSKGVMIGVDYNKDRTWVGGSCAFYEQ
ncbi:MAG: hypothetical protein WBA12_02370 [Catalinimonas sp.]